MRSFAILTIQPYLKASTHGAYSITEYLWFLARNEGRLY
jgi:hypothetical protein